MYIIRRVYIVTMYVLGRLSDIRHLLGSKEVTTCRQVGRLELERLTAERVFFSSPENPSLS